MPKVVVQNWLESEAGWGVRPDGFTVHINRGQRDAYVSWYNAAFNNKPTAPAEYTRADGDPFEVEVSIELFNKITTASLKKVKGRAINGIHGKKNYWNKKSLSDEDISWPVSDADRKVKS